ncbi:MAG: HD-GYP domain-containing protein [Nitrospirae bacterium]|nr:MAG: HD-GYP domain-containing protein [Nitrospirota bacterium]
MATTVRRISDEPHIQVPKDKLIEGTRLTFNVLIKDGAMLVPFFNTGMVFTRFATQVLNEKKISDVFVPPDEREALQSYLVQNQNKKTSDYEELKVFKEYTHFKEQVYQIDRALLVSGSYVDFGLYLLNRFSLVPMVEATGAAPGRIPDKLTELNGDIVIKKQDLPLYNEYLKNFKVPENLPAAEKSKIKAISIKENSKVLMKDLLDDPRSGEKMKQSSVVVNNMVDAMLENPEAIYNLLSLRSYDYYTYTHCVNVAVMSVGLANAIGMKRSEVEKLGVGAMLHDVGKSATPHDILNKQGKLTEQEYRIIQSHVIEGEKLLRGHPVFPQEAIPAVTQHHEKLTGRGYPNRLKGSELHIYGRISSIADCYDALTTRRPYKQAFTPFYALSLIAKETGDYDPDLLKVFIRMLGKIK